MTGLQQSILLSIFSVILSSSLIIEENQCIVTKFNEVADAVKKCTNIIIDGIEVPGGQQLVLHLNEGTHLTFRGKITFGYTAWTGPLVSLTGTNITVRGEIGSIFDGQGALYWDGYGEKLDNNKPRFFKVSVVDSILEYINILNCPILCTLIRNSNNVIISNWNINNLAGDPSIVPQNNSAHNTDGINIEDTNNTLVENSIIYNQDDCVVVARGKNVTVRNMFCHGSHGLSIRGVDGILEDVTFADSILTMGQNGIHVKTPNDGSLGLIQNVIYSNITILDSTKYGVSIQQNYPSGTAKNNIPIRNLQLKNIFGNALDGAVPVAIMCAEEGCFDWDWSDVTVLGAKSNICENYTPNGYTDC